MAKAEDRRKATSSASVSIRVSDFGFLSGFGIRISGLLLRAIDLFSQHIHRIDNADDDGIDGRVSKTGGKPGTAALAEDYQFAHAGADAVHGHDSVHAGTEPGRILFIHQLRAQ